MTREDRSVAFDLAVNYGAMICLAIATNLMPVFLTTFGVDLGGTKGLTNEQLGRIGGINFSGLVAGILVTGPLADRLRAKPFAIAGAVLVASGLAVLSLASTYSQLLVAASILGLGAGVLDMILSPIVCALRPESRTTAMNWLHSFYSIGAICTILAGALALRFGLGWRAASGWLAVVPGLVCLGFVRTRIPSLIGQNETRTPLRELSRNNFFRIALAAILLGGATELGMSQWLPAYAEMGLGFTKWIGSLALLGFSAAMALGRITAGAIGRRVSSVTMLIHCCWISVLFFGVACFASQQWIALAGCIAVGFTASCLWPSMLGLAADQFPRGGATMFGLFAASGNFGGIFMPWLVGVTADVSSINLGLATAALCPLLMVFLLLRMRRPTASDEALISRIELRADGAAGIFSALPPVT
jgi:fucose permease